MGISVNLEELELICYAIDLQLFGDDEEGGGGDDGGGDDGGGDDGGGDDGGGDDGGGDDGGGDDVEEPEEEGGEEPEEEESEEEPEEEESEEEPEEEESEEEPEEEESEEEGEEEESEEEGEDEESEEEGEDEESEEEGEDEESEEEGEDEESEEEGEDEESEEEGEDEESEEEGEDEESEEEGEDEESEEEGEDEESEEEGEDFEERGMDFEAEEPEELEVDEDTYGDRGEYEDVDNDFFDSDCDDWSSDDYDEVLQEVLPENEYFGEDVDDQLEDEGYEPAAEEEAEEYYSSMRSAGSAPCETVSFYKKDDKVVPQGFLTREGWLLIMKLFPDFDFGSLKLVDPPKKEGSKKPPKKLPSKLNNTKPKDKVDLRKYCSPIGNQGPTSRCKAFATTHGYEMLRKIQKKKHVELACSYTMMQFQKVQGDFSDYAFAYESAGTKLGADVMKNIKKMGIAAASHWPNDAEEPESSEDEMSKSAKELKIPFNPTPIKLEDVKKILTKGFPVEFAMKTGKDFQKIGRDGVYRKSEKPEGQHGAHSMLIVGYIGNVFIIKNSWGDKWGDKGYCYIPMNILKEAQLDFNALLISGKDSKGDKKKGKKKK